MHSARLCESLGLCHTRPIMAALWFVVCLAVSHGFAEAAENRQRRSPDGSSSSSSSSSSAGDSYSSVGSAGFLGAMGPGSGGGGSGFFFPLPQLYMQPYQPFDFNLAFQQFIASMAAQQQGYNPQFGNLGTGTSGSVNNAISPDAAAMASVSVGPQGGFGQASVSPTGPDGLGLRIGNFGVPPLSGGGSFSTFSSSSSGTQDAHGRRTSFKQASVGVNDNGNVYFKTVTDP